MHPRVSANSWDQVILKDVHSFYFILAKKTLFYKAVFKEDVMFYEAKLPMKGG